MSISANKGEWSELYVLFKLLGERKIHAGDGNLNKLQEYYPVLKVLRDELKRKMEYQLAQDGDIVIITEDNNEIARINVADFLTHSQLLFDSIKDGGDRAFEIPEQDDFLRKIHCEKVKAKSQDKSDIHVVIHDYHTGMTPNLGFSIKSEAGGSPTLLNASAATLFVYDVEGPADDVLMNDVNAINSHRKIQDRIAKIYDSGCRLLYACMDSDVFRENLQLLDCKMPEIIASMMADSYRRREMHIQKAAKCIADENPLKFNLSDAQDFYGFKIKMLLTSIALGMLPATLWNGRYDATGGYIVVKENGELVCFHIYDRNVLEDYLFNNTKFETPTDKRTGFGKMYKDRQGRYRFNLTLQIRFA